MALDIGQSCALVVILLLIVLPLAAWLSHSMRKLAAQP
jgi:hypothetical protein